MPRRLPHGTRSWAYYLPLVAQPLNAPRVSLFDEWIELLDGNSTRRSYCAAPGLSTSLSANVQRVAASISQILPTWCIHRSPVSIHTGRTSKASPIPRAAPALQIPPFYSVFRLIGPNQLPNLSQTIHPAPATHFSAFSPIC
ncbi:unnamed protein product [Cyclocybe aegerita]|uniref:Uncharacterized protein n=1 Tax=Cyclocybe aegerita TaxID=1973307 RepID=A0A8S0VUL1_CYCAE|nr:unnamed protein product [Cyclocybe aegerita]